jgi:aldose 1-epimerase
MKGKKLIVHDMQQDETHGSFIATTHINNENGYPYSLKIDVTYQLSMEGFHISVNATNTNGGGKPLPFFMGWHPYFKCTAYKSVVTFDNCTGWTHVEMNANLDPTGITATNISIFDGSGPIGGSQTNPTYYDNEYKALTGPISCHKSFQQVRLYDPPTDQTMVLWYNHAFRYVHVYTGLPSADAVAIEPMSGMADAYNNHDGLTVISDGETWSGQFGVYVE